MACGNYSNFQQLSASFMIVFGTGSTHSYPVLLSYTVFGSLISWVDFLPRLNARKEGTNSGHCVPMPGAIW